MAHGNRKAAEAVILKWIDQIDPSGTNSKLYKEVHFSKMDDATFDRYMKAIEEGRDYVSITAPNLSPVKITMENNLKVAREMGFKFFHRIWKTDITTGETFLTNQHYLVVMLPIRRQIQTLENKISIPEDNKHIDDLTDQPTGVSKGSSISAPETLALLAQGCDASLDELVHYRGGDLKGMVNMDRMLHETGRASMKTLDVLGTRAKTSVTLSNFLKGMHLDNNL